MKCHCSVMWHKEPCAKTACMLIATMHVVWTYNKPFELLHSWDFSFRHQWPSYRNSCQIRLLTATLWPCGHPFNVQVMILAGSSGLFNCASTYIEGCYLYIIIHYGISQRGWGIKSVPRGGRPNPEWFKAIDTYTYSKNHTNSPCVCPRIH